MNNILASSNIPASPAPENVRQSGPFRLRSFIFADGTELGLHSMEFNTLGIWFTLDASEPNKVYIRSPFPRVVDVLAATYSRIKCFMSRGRDDLYDFWLPVVAFRVEEELPILEIIPPVRFSRHFGWPTAIGHFELIPHSAFDLPELLDRIFPKVPPVLPGGRFMVPVEKSQADGAQKPTEAKP